MEKEIDFDVIGIAEVLNRDRLRVPPNQREYSWMKEEQVRDLLQDISNAMGKGNQSYFLGTIVLTKGDKDFLEIADGQQRLATSTIILAAIRDWFERNDDPLVVQGIENDYLFNIDVRARERLPRLTLNLDDNEFFMNSILLNRKDRREMHITRRSHRLIMGAASEVRDHFSNLERQLGTSNMKNSLFSWIDYLKKKASIVKLTVLNASDAFIMFETLNDRGLKTSQADLVKNYLFKLADERLNEAQRHWSSMRAAVETVGDEDDLTMEFLRLACCIMAGLTRERDVMQRVEGRANGKNEAIQLISFFDELSSDYAAILNPDHPKWNDYDKVVRRSIRTMNLLGVSQIRPLMLAVARFFKKNHTATAFRKMVSWSVRFMTIGARGSRLDEGYSRLANSIFKGEIKTEEELKIAAINVVVGDAEFETAFQTSRVSVAKLARYYLRSLETTARNQSEPEFIPNDDAEAINLEHVLPQTLENWPNATEQDIETHFARLGNMALLQAGKNSSIGSMSFDDKKTIYSQSTFLLTAQIAKASKWTTKEIDDRQKTLADLAVRTWPL